MKDEGLFSFLFVPCVAVSPPFCDSIDCIIPRVRYLYLYWFSYQYRGDPKSMNKARRDAAGPLVKFGVVGGVER